MVQVYGGSVQGYGEAASPGWRGKPVGPLCAELVIYSGFLTSILPCISLTFVLMVPKIENFLLMLDIRRDIQILHTLLKLVCVFTMSRFFLLCLANIYILAADILCSLVLLAGFE